MQNRVTKDQFFAVIGPMDVHPRVVLSTLREPKPVSLWEDQRTRRLVGVSKGHGEGVEYFLES